MFGIVKNNFGLVLVIQFSDGHDVTIDRFFVVFGTERRQYAVNRTFAIRIHEAFVWIESFEHIIWRHGWVVVLKYAATIYIKYTRISVSGGTIIM